MLNLVYKDPMKKYLLLVLLSTLFTSCNINTTSTNHESDKREAEKITNKFYHYLEMKEFNEAEKLFSEKFFEVTDKEKLHKIFNHTLNDCGNLTNFSLQEWNTFVVKGTNPKSEYDFLYKVTRDKKETTERIGMLKENDSIKIVSYHVNFDMLDE